MLLSLHIAPVLLGSMLYLTARYCKSVSSFELWPNTDVALLGVEHVMLLLRRVVRLPGLALVQLHFNAIWLAHVP
jgi:hypothetical protein